MFLLQSGCNNQDKWKAVPLQITKQESFNYSEMISGELDSTEQAGLEAAKEITAQEMKGNPNNYTNDKHGDFPTNKRIHGFYIWKTFGTPACYSSIHNILQLRL